MDAHMGMFYAIFQNKIIFGISERRMKISTERYLFTPNLPFLNKDILSCIADWLYSERTQFSCVNVTESPHNPNYKSSKGSLSPNSCSEENQSQNQARQVGALPLWCWKPLTARLFHSISSCCFPLVFLWLQIQLYEQFQQKFMKNTQEEFCIFQV